MNRVVLKALAKVNLGLDILGTRENGYHEVKMVMQTVTLHDQLSMQIIEEDKIVLKCNLPYLPVDENNLIVRACRLLKDEFNIKQGVKIDLKKSIPVAAGMAGGSTDAATALYGMNILFKLRLSKMELCARGAKIGADVPFCLMRGTMVAEGIGDELRRIDSMVSCPVLICKPRFSISTKDAYRKYDELKSTYHPDIDTLVDAIRFKDLDAICKNMGNVLEEVAIKEYPILKEIEEELVRLGAKKAMMSGSGPTIFAIFDNKETAMYACEMMKSRKKEQVYLTSFYN